MEFNFLSFIFFGLRFPGPSSLQSVFLQLQVSNQFLGMK